RTFNLLITSNPVDDDDQNKLLFEAFVETGFGRKLPDGRYEFADSDQLTLDEKHEISIAEDCLKLVKDGHLKKVGKRKTSIQFLTGRPFPNNELTIFAAIEGPEVRKITH